MTRASGPTQTSRARGLLLVDHGSRQQLANAQLIAVAERIAASKPDWLVGYAHMEISSPSIEEALADLVSAGASHVIVHPFLLAPGKHSRETIPKLVSEAARRHDNLEITITEPLGLHDKLIEVVLDRIHEATSRAAENTHN